MPTSSNKCTTPYNSLSRAQSRCRAQAASYPASRGSSFKALQRSTASRLASGRLRFLAATSCKESNPLPKKWRVSNAGVHWPQTDGWGAFDLHGCVWNDMRGKQVTDLVTANDDTPNAICSGHASSMLKVPRWCSLDWRQAESTPFRETLQVFGGKDTSGPTVVR